MIRTLKGTEWPGDAALVERLKGGDEEAFAAPLRRHQGKVYRLAMNITRNPEDAEEVTQDVFLTVYRKIGTFNGRAGFGTWLYRVAANAALIKLRRRRGEPHLPIDDVGPAFTAAGSFARPVADWSDLPEDHLLAVELRRVLEQAIEALPPGSKAVVVLRDIVKSRLHRARISLREKLAAYFEAGRGRKIGASAPLDATGGGRWELGNRVPSS